MKPLIEIPPRTIMEVYKMLPEGTLAEIIDNQIYMSPSPLFNHQDVLLEVASQLKSYFASTGKVAIAPFDVFLDDDRNAVQPDILVVLNSNPNKIEAKRHFHGVPDLVVEILSPGNMDHDLVKKRLLYERFGIKEYWIIHPETKAYTVHCLKDGTYTEFSSGVKELSSPLVDTKILF